MNAELHRGDRVELLGVPADYEPYGLTAGEHGTVDFVDSLGTVHIRWKSGRRVGVIAQDLALIRVIPPAG